MVTKPHLDEEALTELQEVMEGEFPLLVETYLNDSRERIETLSVALKNKDADTVTKAAHSFKGSCINIGAPRLGALCLELEQAGREERLDDAPPILAAVEEEFVQVANAFHELLARKADTDLQ